MPVVAFKDADAWLTWLKKAHASSPGVRIKFAKKHTKRASVSYAQAVEGALCWGWIDGQASPFDADHWLVRFTPRGPRSVWSKINRNRALALIASDAMQAPGLAEIERAKQSGRWDAAYDSPRTATVPDDLTAALAKNRAARAFFETLNAANRYAILWRLQTAKLPETRARRLTQFIAMLERQETLHPQARPRKAT
ncbi:MAG: YdeI/OmpD-associated family protein [Polyangiales bacterium]